MDKLKEPPFVSVLMTAFNREVYIAEAIESVLSSTYKNFELIIVDDCSTDKTVTIAESYKSKDDRIKLHCNQKNIGQFANRNNAAFLAKGEYIKFFDSDDIMYPDMLESLVEGMINFPGAALAASIEYAGIEKSKLPLKFSPREAYINHYFAGETLLYAGPSATIYCKAIFLSLGGFNETVGILADTLISLQIAANSPVVVVKNNLFLWRRHEAQITIGQLDKFQMIKERFNINEVVLCSEDCPFNETEKNIVRTNLKNIFIRNIILDKNSIKSVSKILELLKLYNVSFIDLIKAMIPNKRIIS